MENCCPKFKQEFNKHNFRVLYVYPDYFMLHQWQSDAQVDGFYLCYRFAFMVIFLGIQYAIFRFSHYPIQVTLKMLVYFSYWAFLLCLCSAVLGLLIVARGYIRQNTVDPLQVPNFPKLFSVYWVTHCMAVELTLLVSAAYWAMVVPTQQPALSVLSWTLHAWTAVLMLMDFFVVGLEVKILHVYFTLLVGLLYVTTNGIYYEMGGTNIHGQHYIYKVLDWKETPGTAALICVIVMILMIVFRVILFGLYRLRLWICNRYYAPTLGFLRRSFILW